MRFIKRGVLIVAIIAVASFIYVQKTCAQSCPAGDINRDSKISLSDYELFRRLFRGDTPTSVPTQPPGGGIPANPKIMPLGDSITMGMHGLGADWDANKSLRGGYRAKLYELLTANGTTFNFVGSFIDPRETFPDKENEGHGGWCITGGGGSCFADGIDPAAGGNGGLSHHINGWLATYQPDVILLHIGTNDFNGGDQVNDVATRYGQLIDKIFAARPNVFLFVSNLNIVGRTDVNTTFNNQLQSMIQQKAGTGKKVFYVNTYQGMAQPIGSGGDTLHPSLANYEVMGQNWFNAMKPHLGGGPAPTTPPGGGTNPVGLTGNFTMTFQDEFNTFNTANWTRTYPWDTSGNERRDTDGGTGQIINPANVTVSGGILRLAYKKIPPETINGMTREWETGMMHSRGKKEFGSSPTGTYMEVRAKAVTGGPGQWSFVWLLPNDFATDPTCPVQRYTLKMHETNGKYLQYNNFNVKKRVSCESTPSNLADDIKTYQFSSPLSQAFHTYGMDWYPDHIDFYFDGQKVHTSAAINGIDRPGFLIINGYVITNIGLNDKNFFPFDGVPTSATPTTAEYQVDYVRVWKRS